MLKISETDNDDLPFYYFTSSHDRFYEGPRSYLTKEKKTKRLPKAGQIQVTSLISGQTSFPMCGTLTTRPKFQKQPIRVLPPSTASVHIV